MTDLYWDEVLLSHNPDSKELEVSFKKIDGSGLLSQGSEPGTPGGATEDSDGNTGPTDDEGDLISPNDPVEDGQDNGGGGGGDPIAPTPDQHPECLPQDCSAYEVYVDPPGVSSSQLWTTTFGLTLPPDTIPQASLRDLRSGSEETPRTLVLDTLYRYANVNGSGPCGINDELYSVSNTNNEFNFNRQWVPSAIPPVAGLQVGPGGGIEVEGELTVYVSFKDRDGNEPTRGTLNQGLIRNPMFSHGGDFIGQSSGNFASNVITMDVFQDAETGRAFLTSNTAGAGNIQNIEIPGGEATGAYTISFRNTLNFSNDGEILMTAYACVEAFGIKLEANVYDGRGGNNNCWYPRLSDNRQFPLYLLGGLQHDSADPRPRVTGMSGGGSVNEIEAWVTAWERSQIEYTPPTYCERIPT